MPGCGGLFVKKDLALSKGFQPSQYKSLAVINLDPQVRFSEYVEAELVRKGYQVKDSALVRKVLRQEGLEKEEGFDPQALAKIGSLLQVQGIVLCSVLEFSRFRDSYRLNIKMVAPNSGNTIWSAQGAKEGSKGQKSSELLKDITASSLRGLPAVK